MQQAPVVPQQRGELGAHYREKEGEEDIYTEGYNIIRSTENISYTIKKCLYFSYTTTFFGLFLIYYNYGI
jgi:hypothetical protein